MTVEPVAMDELLAARETLIASVAGGMTEAHKEFFLGFKRDESDWKLLNIPGAEELPAVHWKQLNLDKLSACTRDRLVPQLTELLRQS